MNTNKAIAQQIRETLDNTFYKTAFSVQCSGKSIKVIWTDGPTKNQLMETLTGINANIKTTRHNSSLFINGAIQTWKSLYPEQAETVISCVQGNGDAWYEFDVLDSNTPNVDYLETIVNESILNGTEFVFSR